MLSIFIKKILIILIYSIIKKQYTEINFDKKSLELSQKAIYTVFGFRNFENKGPIKGCCGQSFLKFCLACQYQAFVSMQGTRGISPNNYRLVYMGHFHKKKTILFQTMSFKILTKIYFNV
ncbi:hypothetical protein HZS_6903, partial [Henneguya salminicola]